MTESDFRENRERKISEVLEHHLRSLASFLAAALEVPINKPPICAIDFISSKAASVLVLGYLKAQLCQFYRLIGCERSRKVYCKDRKRDSFKIRSFDVKLQVQLRQLSVESTLSIRKFFKKVRK